jgi:nitrogen regulatory protein PII
MERAHVKLVTVIARSEFQDHLGIDLVKLGASGYTIARVSGHGRHGFSERNFLEDGNIRFECIVTQAVADAILDYVEREAAQWALVAFAHDIEVVPRRQFER